MHGGNQDDPRERTDAAGASDAEITPAQGDTAPAFEAPGPALNSEQGLLRWLVAIAALGLSGLLFGQQELAGLIAVAGLYVAAQAADQDRRWRLLYFALAWIVPLSGVGAFFALATMLQTATIAAPLKTFLLGFTGWAAITAVILWIPPAANALVQVLFRAPPSHTLRLTARLVATGLLLSVPAAFALRDVMLELLESPQSPLTSAMFVGSLIGYVALALAGVGFKIRRTTAETIARLGLRPLSRRDLAISGITVIALLLLTAGADAAQKRWLHDLWVQDQAMTAAIAGKLSIGAALLLGISAGIGEEITMRGALQPRLGLALTSLLFASLHVQYTWFGLLVIFLLGALLGIVRARTSTSVVMLAHTVFDVIAVFTA